MPMISCRECGASVSSTARQCPSCGAPRKRMRGGLGCLRPALFALALLVIIGGIGSALFPNGHGSTSTPLNPQERLDAANEAARNTAALEALTALKKNLRDPSSLQVDHVSANEDGSVVCIRYRARNGFGGLNLEHLVNWEGKALTSPSQWNKHCSHQKLHDETAVSDLVE